MSIGVPRRRLLQAIGALTLGAAAGACGSPRQPPARQLVLRHPKLFGDPRPLEMLIESFELDHGVMVRREALPASSDEQHLFYAINLRARSQEFDVFALDTIWVAEFAKAGWLRDVSHLFAPTADADFFPGPLASVAWEGRRYALPWFVDAGVLYYRADLLGEQGITAPRTWAELVVAAQRVRRTHPGMHGFVWQGKQYEGLVCNALEFIWSHGGDLGAQREAAARGLAFMRSLVTSGVTPAFVTTLTEEPARVLFGRGKSVFMRNWPYAWRLLEQEGSAVRGKVGVRALPHAPGHAAAATLGGWHLGVNAFSARAELAGELAAFLSAAPAQKALALAYGYSPPRRVLYADPDVSVAQPFLSSLGALLETARPRPVSPHYVALSQTLQAEFSATLTGLQSPMRSLAAIESESRALESR